MKIKIDQTKDEFLEEVIKHLNNNINNIKKVGTKLVNNGIEIVIFIENDINEIDYDFDEVTMTIE